MKKPTKKTTKKEAKDLSIDIMSAIKKGEVTMRPKAYFVVGSLLLGAGLAIALTLAFFFLTASAFHLRNAGSTEFLRYGGLGAPLFIRLFPWRPLLLAVLGIGGGLWFLKKYDVSYKKNFALISLALVGALVVFAIAFDRMGANDRLEKTKRFEPLYRQEFDKEHLIRGIIITVNDSSLLVEERRERQNIEVVWDEKTMFPTGKDFTVGEEVGAIGEREGMIFKAKGIHRAPSPRFR
jgi:hypothetical protein